MNQTMNAIVIERYGPPEELKSRQMAVPGVGPDEVLVRVFAAGVNPKDAMIRKGKFKLITGKRFPRQMGYDFSGEIAKIGEKVIDFQAGEPVYGMINDWRGGAYAEYAAVKPSEMARKPDNLGFNEAAAIPLAGQTALQALRNLGKIKAGDQVCINGSSGGVGTFAVQIAKSFHADVTAVCSERNIQLCKGLGADDVIDYNRTPVEDTAKRFNIFFDVFGNKSLCKIRRLLMPGGVYIATVPNGKNMLHHLGTLAFADKKARIVFVKSNTDDLLALSALIENGRIKPVIDAAYPLEQAAKAHAYIETKRARGKVVLTIEGS